jgi:hypothetical protein
VFEQVNHLAQPAAQSTVSAAVSMSCEAALMPGTDEPPRY